MTLSMLLLGFQLSLLLDSFLAMRSCTTNFLYLIGGPFRLHNFGGNDWEFISQI